MRERILCVIVLLGALGLTACGSSGSIAPKLIFNNLQAALQAHAGDNVAIQYVTWDDDGPDLPASTSFFADIDGDLTTTGDQVVIALNRTNNDGVNMAFNWNTSGVAPAVYNIVALTVDQAFAVQTTAAGKVTVFAFAITKPTVNQNRTVLAGATVNIDYIYNDPDSTPTTDAYADRDGSLGTTDDQYLIAEDVPENGGSQTIAWDTEDVDPGTYFLILVNNDGAQGTRQFTAGGTVTVITVTAFAPDDETTLLSTAYNARITFSHSLTLLGAVINGAKVVVEGDESGIIPGAYTLENNGTEINFQPAAGYFPADDIFAIDVRTDMLFSDAAATSSAFSEFATSISPAFLTSYDTKSIAVMDVSDPENPEQIDQLDLDPADTPKFSVCASDGLLYMSMESADMDGIGAVVAYDTVGGERLSPIALPPANEGGSVTAYEIVLSPDESRLYCAATDFPGDGDAQPILSIIDRLSRTEIGRVQLNLAGDSRGVALSPDGRWAYVTNYTGNAIHVVDTLLMLEVDTDGVSGNGISPILTIDPYPAGIAVSADSTTIYVSHGKADKDGNVVNVSTFSTTTFAEGFPLISMANARAGTPALVFDDVRGLLYAGRGNIDDSDGLSIFTPYSPTETIIDTAVGGANNSVLRGVAIVWGTPFIVLADVESGIIVVNVESLEAVSHADADNGSRDVSTIPPRRY